MTLLLFLNTQRRDADLGNRDYISYYDLWTIGVLLVVVADMQKSTSRTNSNYDVRKNEKL